VLRSEVKVAEGGTFMRDEKLAADQALEDLAGHRRVGFALA
jgi:hypothetical protein